MVELEDVVWNLDYDGEDFNVKLSGGEELQGQIWACDGDAKFCYVFVHGFAVFGPFKKDLWPILNAEGGIVFACDHKGHGRSPGAPVSCTIEEVVEETIEVLRFAHERYPALPLIVHGHSMGGLTVLSLLMRQFKEVSDLPLKGAIVEAPWITPNPQRGFEGVRGWVDWGLLKLMGWIAPTVLLPTRMEVFSEADAPEWVALMRGHPRMMGDKLTTRLFWSAVNQYPWIIGNPQAWPAEIPLLYVVGEADRIVQAPRVEEFGRAVAGQAGVNATVRVYGGGSHMIFKTAARREAIEDLLSFIRPRVGVSRAPVA